jgi:hypothetical protein
MHVIRDRLSARLRASESWLRPVAARTWSCWALAATLARLPGNMAPLALIVILPGSRGAIAAAGYTVGVGFGAAWRGRAIDRAGVRTGLRREGLLLAAASTVLSVVVAVDGPTAAIVAAAAVAGVAGSAVGVAYRAALVSFVPGSSLSSAYTIDAVLTEVSFVASPLIVGLFAAATPAYVLFAVAAALAAGSYIAGSALPGTAAGPGAGRRDTRGWLRAGAPVFVITGVIGFGYGLLMAGLPARLIDLGWSSAAAATLFAVMSATSAVVAVVIAVTRRSPAPRLSLVAVLCVPFAAATAALAFAPNPVTAAAAMALFGAPLAVLNGLASTALNDRIPEGALARAFAVLAAMITINSGLGFALAAILLTAFGGAGTLAAAHAVFLVLTLSLIAAHLRTRDRQHTRVKSPFTRTPHQDARSTLQERPTSAR